MKRYLWFLPFGVLFLFVNFKYVEYESLVESPLIVAAQTPHPYIARFHLEMALDGITALQLNCYGLPGTCHTSIFGEDARDSLATWRASIIFAQNLVKRAPLEVSNQEKILIMQRVQASILWPSGQFKAPSLVFLHPYHNVVRMGFLLTLTLGISGLWASRGSKRLTSP